MEGGIDDVGLGVLFGLNNYRYDFTGIIMHAEHLEAYKGVGPHTISVPRVRPAEDIDPEVFDNGLSDDTFAKIVACIRIAVPYTGMIVSTREKVYLVEKVFYSWESHRYPAAHVQVSEDMLQRKKKKIIRLSLTL